MAAIHRSYVEVSCAAISRLDSDLKITMAIQKKTRSRQASRRPLPNRVKMTRAQKTKLNREKLFDAAAKIVGRHGYSDAMVALITTEANVAQGTFYNYFDSQQDLFDQLLPACGEQMLEYIRRKQTGAADDLDREERAFRGFFDFLKEQPEFYRILYEAELFAPKAYQKHLQHVAKAYVRVLQRSRAAGEIRNLNAEDVEPVAFMLMGARHYLAKRYARIEGRTVALPQHVLKSYMKLYRNTVG